MRQGKHARRTPRSTTISVTISFAVAFAAVATALIMHAVATQPSTEPESAPTPVAHAVQPVIQEGRLIAVSPTSLTAMGPDGVARTFLVDDQTHGVTAHGSQLGGTSAAFAVNDEVSIVGVSRGEQKIATTVVHREAMNLNGPPMDYALP
ncbi:hypothetical protein AVZ31_15795 [Mycolicibacterium neoaurum]|uniref:DUF5666 domain-containing protein n=1 Tax=Mycolicibacterium neoaurum VKM Ac-1815D TaxID=700508 RepID=V5X7B8_MYCNE|nr:hypothetical protein MyAD_03340 [Mycolicibacterium neoaurum]AXK77338.1 hypothetical protein DXK33_21785 [Mycolicibacterium neoaurum]KUM07434.1 hypothetical protein AVZ31_15795 [Mycolicibacterium neoaurum]